MCGITGAYYFKHNTATSTQIEASLVALRQRGPDNAGSFTDEKVFLGHTRLSIIDVSAAANQPFTDSTGNYQLIFNGEIFNYRELKTNLAEAGVLFKTESDTEVLLYWLIHKGISGISVLNGFFSFAFYNVAEKSVLIARDHFGIKPLVYHQNEKQITFSSELKGLFPFLEKKEVDKSALQLYLELSYLPAPFTLLKGVKKLEPGHYLHISAAGVTKQSFYQLPLARREADNLQGTLEKNIREKLEIAVQRRLISDVPVGTFLSGGVDSAIVTALAAKHHPGIQSFSIGFKDNASFDESKAAEKTARYIGSDHHTFMLNEDDLFQHFESALDYLDEPFADSSALNVYVLSREVSSRVKVALSGDGADELFGGYNKHLAHAKAAQKTVSNKIIRAMLPFLEANKKTSTNGKYANRIRRAAKYSAGLKLSVEERYRMWASWGSTGQVARLLKQDFSPVVDSCWDELYIPAHADELNDVLYNDMRIVLEGDMLRKIDSMSMANSLEVRPPFLDQDLVNYVMQLPASLRYQKNNAKALLKSTFKELLPAEVFNRPKRGFEVPLTRFIQGAFKVQAEALLADELIESQGFFDVAELQKIKKRAFDTGSIQDIYLLWAVTCFQYWFNTYLAER